MELRRGGPGRRPDVLALRARQSRALLTTLLLSFGIPMLLGGDEMGRTQQGNNNAYCQDNEIAWFDWSQPDTELLAFTRQLVTFRRSHPAFRRRRFLGGDEAPGLRWFTPGGSEMTAGDWSDASALAVALYLDGTAPMISRHRPALRPPNAARVTTSPPAHGPLSCSRTVPGMVPSSRRRVRAGRALRRTRVRVGR